MALPKRLLFTAIAGLVLLLAPGARCYTYVPNPAKDDARALLRSSGYNVSLFLRYFDFVLPEIFSSTANVFVPTDDVFLATIDYWGVASDFDSVNAWIMSFDPARVAVLGGNFLQSHLFQPEIDLTNSSVGSALDQTSSYTFTESHGIVSWVVNSWVTYASNLVSGEGYQPELTMTISTKGTQHAGTWGWTKSPWTEFTLSFNNATSTSTAIALSGSGALDSKIGIITDGFLLGCDDPSDEQAPCFLNPNYNTYYNSVLT